ncbi:hypothetical protein [Streptomyces sp. NPDC007083]|uniref:hypothetical protein n=1 Tax=unclassified Streptomyces TaxID=2593676 RepID=UPI0033FC69C7
MRVRSPRCAGLLAAAVLSAAALGAGAGCGRQQAGDGPDGGGSRARADRARQVAAAWDGSRAAATWRAGYHPLGEVVRTPRGGLHSSADREAYRSGSFVLRGELPAAERTKGRVVRDGGRSLTRPLISAHEAFEALKRGTTEPHLTVTGAKPGELSVATGQGRATVPAWLFTLEGYDAPLVRAAAVPSALPRSPIGHIPGSRSSLEHLVRISPDGRAVTVAARHGVCDDGARVEARESSGSVVLTASVQEREDREPDALCTKQAVRQQVTVTLRRPLGDRILLDADFGRPVPFRSRLGPTPSWS